MDNMTVREWVQKLENGEFDAMDRMTQRYAGWSDYFCSRDSLTKRLKKMGNIIKDIKSDYILDNYRVWFKNNCPCCFPLCDDFRFEPINEDRMDVPDEERDKLYFAVKCDHPFGSQYRYEVVTAIDKLATELSCTN